MRVFFEIIPIPLFFGIFFLIIVLVWLFIEIRNAKAEIKARRSQRHGATDAPSKPAAQRPAVPEQIDLAASTAAKPEPIEQVTPARSSITVDGIEIPEVTFSENDEPEAKSQPAFKQEKGPVDVELTSIGVSEVIILKTICDTTGWNITKAKQAADHAPFILMDHVSLDTAARAKALFEREGATITLKESHA